MNSCPPGLVPGELQQRSAKVLLPASSTTESQSWGASPPQQPTVAKRLIWKSVSEVHLAIESGEILRPFYAVDVYG
jgi:hypothetical protein